MKRLEDILARCEAATKGPWIVIGEDDDGKGQFLVHSNTEQAGCDEEDSGHGTIGHTEAVFQITDASYGHAGNYHENAEFIAHARTDLPLVTKALQKAMEALRNRIPRESAYNQLWDETAQFAASTLAEIEALLGETK